LRPLTYFYRIYNTYITASCDYINPTTKHCPRGFNVLSPPKPCFNVGEIACNLFRLFHAAECNWTMKIAIKTSARTLIVRYQKSKRGGFSYRCQSKGAVFAEVPSDIEKTALHSTEMKLRIKR
jgi:hypothetical protein